MLPPVIWFVQLESNNCTLNTNNYVFKRTLLPMYIRTTQTNLKICWRASETQGPRSTFEIGGGRGVGGGGRGVGVGAPLVTQYWGGAQDTFSYKLFIILKILGGGGERALSAPLFRGP